MSHQDGRGNSSARWNYQDLKVVVEWLLEWIVLAGVRFRSDSRWSPRRLIAGALVWTWSDEATLADRLGSARRLLIRGWDATAPSTSYQGFVKLLRRWTTPLAVALTAAFRQRMQWDLRARMFVAGRCVFGVDGSAVELPRTKSNEQHFAPQSASKKPRRGRGHEKSRVERQQARPQAWLTTLWHVGTGLPWDWRSGPGDSSEREHFRQMMDSLPDRSLMTADAGFVGYEYWKALIDRGHDLLIRVGSNVRLLRELGEARERSGLVYLWPDRAAKRLQPPLTLRLVILWTGRYSIFLVTSILDERQLSDTQAADIYRQRWGVELFYRHFKQTFQRRKLRSHCASNAELELTWSFLGFWAMALHAEVELKQYGIPARKISIAGVLRAYRHTLRDYRLRAEPDQNLSALLRRAVIDSYTRRNKASRSYPRRKQEPVPRAPQIVRATPAQRHNAQQFQPFQSRRLTA